VTDARTTEQALDDLDRPQAHLLEGHDAGWLARLFASPWWRRPIPAPVALGAARLIGLLRWMLLARERRRASIWAMRMLNSPRPTRATRRLARRGMVEHAVKVELMWRPWTVARMEIKGIEHLRAARRGGRGVILASAHLGSWVPLLQVLGRREGRIWVARFRAVQAGDVLPGWVGLALVARQQWLDEARVRFVGRGGSYDILRKLLERGDVCFLMFDFPGRTETKFLGRRVRLASGTATLATTLGAPVVPVFPIRRGHRQIGEMLPPIWPADFASAGELHDHLAKLVTRTMRKHAWQAYPPKTVLGRQVDQAVRRARQPAS
jgi:lauroyl/myristoyl acyltransferase